MFDVVNETVLLMGYLDNHTSSEVVVLGTHHSLGSFFNFFLNVTQA